MTRVVAERLAFAFSSRAPVLTDASFVLEAGFWGLVGPNGAGKTTLLSLIAGALRPEQGAVRVEPEGALVVLCPQEVELADAHVRRLAESDERAAHRLRATLGLQRVDGWTTLSPGERKRWQIAAALAREPEVLLLDEPSNHLDSGARDWLLSALGRFGGVAVVVSHDRELLDRLTTSTLELRSGAVRIHAGGYSRARASWEAERTAAEGERLLAVDRVERLARRLHAVRQEERSASAQRSTRRRMKNRHDSDARGMGAQTRADWAAARHGRRVEVVRRELEQARSGLGEHTLEKQLGGSVFARFEPAKSALVAWREAGPLVAGERVLFDAPALGVRRDDRIWLSGDNGAGKSTLIRELLSDLRIAADEVLVLPQDLPESAAIGALEQARRLPADERGRVLSILGALGVDPERLLASRRPSPGEARKLVMATGLGRLARALVLDEPENHLDLPSIERLELALAAYPGALLLVTHDAALARRTARTRWQLDAGGIRVSALGD